MSWRQKKQAALKNAGYDTGRYLAISIPRADIPENGEVVITVRDTLTGELRPVAIRSTGDAYAFAGNSIFRGQAMADGFIFNPYSHRRFIAAQFEKLIRQYGHMGIRDGFAQSRGWDYAIDVLRKEIHRLANLVKHDGEVFRERARFFTLDACAAIIRDYVEAVHRYVDKAAARNSQHAQFYLKGHGCVERKNLRPLKHRFDRLAHEVRQCVSYAQLDAVLEAFEWMQLPAELVLPWSFVNPFLESGAYYTLKHHMMFQGLTMHRDSQTGSLTRLREHRQSYLPLYSQLMG